MLDDLMDRSVAFVKIDTEGHEPQVFDGAREMLHRLRLLGAELVQCLVVHHAGLQSCCLLHRAVKAL